MVKKAAYLTIDDAPTVDFRAKIDYLAERNIPAIFFCIGRLLEERPADTVYAIHKGFVIGNHTYSHPHCSELTVAECCEEIQRTHEIVEDIYQQAEVPRPGRFFRFPYGDKGGLQPNAYAPLSAEGAARKTAIQRYLRELGYTQPAFPDVTYPHFRQAGLLEDVDWYWTYDCFEWSVHNENPVYGITSLEKVLARMDENAPTGGRGLNVAGSAEIILTHDHAESTEIFWPIVERLAEKGMQFQPIPLT